MKIVISESQFDKLFSRVLNVPVDNSLINKIKNILLLDDTPTKFIFFIKIYFKIKLKIRI